MSPNGANRSSARNESSPRTAGADRRPVELGRAERRPVQVEKERSDWTLTGLRGANRRGRRAVEAGRVRQRVRREPDGVGWILPAGRGKRGDLRAGRPEAGDADPQGWRGGGRSGGGSSWKRSGATGA